MTNNGMPTQFANICLYCETKTAQPFLLSKFSLATLNTSFLLGNFSAIAARRLETNMAGAELWNYENINKLTSLIEHIMIHSYQSFIVIICFASLTRYYHSVNELRAK